ncbi:MFS transporter [Rhodococcus sp. 15-649-2-2]|uniref:MFS transporter n=1 Tax=Rhodococcus sp. 15-649-2-2 TaxID=2023140 RepID=UPI000B9B1901|nr:MFS transporter [Rhodococcus sp. 15-649-2-2]OZE81615.1 MFS transporter [Rhodococcus sp. 15-649-2-2]
MTTRVRPLWIAVFSVAWLGYWMADLVPLQLLLPERLQQIDPQSKVFDFAVINAVSAVVLLIGLPVCGSLCDRTRSRLGRRRVWFGGGVLFFACALVVTGLQSTVLGIGTAWSVAMLGSSAATAGLTAVVADRVPDEQRGTVSSAIYAPQALGVVAGLALVSTLALSVLGGYLAVAIALVICAVPFLLSYRETDSPTALLSLRSIVASLLDSLRHRDFAWAFGGRILVNVANSLGTCYLLFFLTDGLRVTDPTGSLLEVTVVYLIACVVCTFTFGPLSDRMRRRKIFVAVAASMQAVAGFVLAVHPTMDATFVSAALLGGGFGAYMAVDQALVTGVLPSAESRATDLGVMNIGAIVPPAMAPLLASVFLSTVGGYPALFAAVGVLAALGAAVTWQVKSVR